MILTNSSIPELHNGMTLRIVSISKLYPVHNQEYLGVLILYVSEFLERFSCD